MRGLRSPKLPLRHAGGASTAGVETGLAVATLRHVTVACQRQKRGPSTKHRSTSVFKDRRIRSAPPHYYTIPPIYPAANWIAVQMQACRSWRRNIATTFFELQRLFLYALSSTTSRLVMSDLVRVIHCLWPMFFIYDTRTLTCAL